MFYTGDVKPNEYTSMIFNGNTFGPTGSNVSVTNLPVIGITALA